MPGENTEGLPANPARKSFKDRFVGIAQNTAKAALRDVLTPAENAEIKQEFNDLAEVANTDTEVKTPFWWPHEHLDELKAAQKANNPLVKAVDASIWAAQSYLHVHKTAKHESIRMRKVNGEGSEVLSNKYTFVETAKNLGYPSQKQVLIEKGVSADVRSARINDEFTDFDQAVFLKPVGRAGGHGIKITTASDAGRLLENEKYDYVVQEAVNVDREYRYMTYQDGEHTWRIAYEKKRPTLRGDGKSTLAQLLSNESVPLTTRAATFAMHTSRVNQIIPSGEEIQMTQVLFPSEGRNFESMPKDQHEVDNLDKFMAQFITDLEGKIGHKLPLLAFDIGFRDVSVLKGDYDLDAIKASFAPFECQMPFGTFFYYKNVPQGHQVLLNFFSLMREHQGKGIIPVAVPQDK